MLNIIGIGGEPAVGKTALVRFFIKSLTQKVAPVVYGKLKGMYFVEDNVYVLGTYTGKDFDGTDQLAFDVQANAMQFIDTLRGSRAAVVFEGDRLFNGSFMDYCQSLGHNCHWVVLEGNLDDLASRRKHSGKGQTASFVQGRREKLGRLKQSHRMEVWRNDNIASLATNTARLRKLAGCFT